MNATYKSNGKFLLSGEYLVLKGAKALALPLKLGQDLKIKTLESNDNRIYWDAFVETTDYGLRTTGIGNNIIPWFSVVLDKNSFEVIDTDDREKAERLSEIFKIIKHLNDNILDSPHDYHFNSLLDFSPHWGLGSSSTLINNLSLWADIDPYSLLNATFKGSGYDIACANTNKPLFYQLDNHNDTIKRIVTETDFKPAFNDNLFFIYQGKKQNSAKEVKAFLDKNKNYNKEIMSVSEISKALSESQSLDDFCYYMKKHEEIIAFCISQTKIKDFFPDFQGEMKSLGAWGGDFFLAATSSDYEYVRHYFENKGLNTIIKYQDIVF